MTCQKPVMGKKWEMIWDKQHISHIYIYILYYIILYYMILYDIIWYDMIWYYIWYYILLYYSIWYYGKLCMYIYIILTYVHIYNMTQLLQNEMNEYIYMYSCIHVYIYIIEITNKIILDTYLTRHILKIHLKNLETFLGSPILTGFMRLGKMPSIDFLVPQKRWSSLGVQSNCRMVLVCSCVH